MKKIFTAILFTVLAIFVVQAKNPTKPEKENLSTEMDEYDIPKEVSNWLTKELSNSSTAVLKSFDTPEFYTSKNAKIIGYIKGYDKTQGAKTGIFYYDNELINETETKVLEIHEDGRFELELPLEYPMYSSFLIENNFIQFYIEPGQNLSIILDKESLDNKVKSKAIDLKNFKNEPKTKIIYQGLLKNINTDLHNYEPDFPLGKIYSGIDNMKPMEFKKHILGIKDEMLVRIESYKQSGDIGVKTSELLENQISLNMYYHLFEYFMYNKKDYLVPEGYYDFIKDLPLNKQSILVSSEFGGMINELEFSKPLKVKANNKGYSYDASISRFLKFLENRNVEVFKSEKEKLINENKGSSAFQEKHKFHYDEFIAMVNAEVKILREQNFKNNEIEKWKRKDSLASVLGFKNDIAYGIIKLRSLNSVFKWNSGEENYDLNKWLWDYMQKSIKSSQLKKVGDKLLKTSLTKTDYYELSESDKGTSILKKIIAPYQGKLVILRFWRPYANYKEEKLNCFKQLREQYRNNKDIEFIDVSLKGIVSEELYADFVKAAGYKNAVTVSQDEYNYLVKLLQFSVSSKNFVIDKKGRILKDWYPRTKIASYLKSKFKIKPLDELKEEELIGCFK